MSRRFGRNQRRALRAALHDARIEIAYLNWRLSLTRPAPIDQAEPSS